MAMSDNISGAFSGVVRAIAMIRAQKQDKLGYIPADAADTYTKTQIDGALGNKQDKLGFIPASAAAVTTALETKADLVGGKVPAAQLPAPPTVPTFATVAEVRAGKTAGKIIDPQTMADALWPVAIDRTAAAAGMPFDSFINCNISLDANGTLGPPSGGYPGKSGVINVTNAAGSATMAFASAYRMPKGGITIEAGVNALTRIPYTISDAGFVVLFPASKWSA